MLIIFQVQTILPLVALGRATSGRSVVARRPQAAAWTDGAEVFYFFIFWILLFFGFFFILFFKALA
jgi:hypothetical protein